MRRFVSSLALYLCLLSSVLAQSIPFPGPGMPASAGASYQGPGDVIGSASFWGSCARAYNAAYANGTNPLCDLVDSAAPTVVICTLRAATTGFVDLTGAYCTGSVTPAVKCAAATGGVCNVSKVYDQTGNGNHPVNTTAASQPVLTFTGLNSLPGLTCVNASNTLLAVASFTLAQPFSIAAVYQRSSGTAQGGVLASNSNTLGLYAGNGVANRVDLSAGTTTSLTGVNDGAYHAAQAIINGASPNSIMAADGASNTGSSGAGAFSASILRLCRGSVTLQGFIMEAGIWSGAWNSTQWGNINTNAHSSTSGYNF